MSISARICLGKRPKPVWTLLMLATISGFVAANGPGSVTRQHGRVDYVIDADTFRLKDGTRIRIAAIDAAETRLGQAKCTREIEIGKAATERVRTLIDSRDISYQVVGRSYRRLVAKVWFRGRDLGETLVTNGAARPWPRGRPKPDWCR